METPAPAAPAPPAPTTETVSASIDAANRGDFDAFDRAELGKRTGQPVADVPATTEAAPAPAAAEAAVDTPPAPGQPDRQISKRQQQTNDAIRTAVDRATADDKRRIAELELQLRGHTPAPPAPAPPAPPVAAPAKTTAEWKRYHAMPDAPKLADFDSVEEHSAAMALFIADRRYDERDAQTREQSTRTQTELQRIDGFLKQITDAKTDPAFTAAMDAAKTASPEFAATLNALKPFGALAEGEQGGPLNAIAEQVYDSPYVKDVLLHFAQHPEALARLEAGPAQLAAIPIAQRTDAQAKFHIRWIDHEFKRLEGRLAGLRETTTSTAAPAAPSAAAAHSSPITAAPPPPPTLRAAGNTSDPKAAALARGDFAEFDRLELEERMATRTSAR